MSTCVIYASKYGHTKKYAEWISQALSCPSLSLQEAQKSDLSAYQTLIFGSSIYAGQIKGKEFLIQQLDKELVIFTVGLSDPNQTDYQPVLDQSLTDEVKKKAKIFHLRAGMNFKKLSLVHKAMMWMMKKSVFDKTPLEKQDSDFKTMMDNYYQGFDYANPKSIQDLVTYVKHIE